MPTLEELTLKHKQKITRKNKGRKILYIVLQALTVLTAIGSLVLYFVYHNNVALMANQLFMCVMALLFLNIPLLVEKKFKIYVPNYITIILYVFIFTHFVIGEIYRLYDNSVIFDKILHTTSGVVMSFVGFSFIFMLNKMTPEKVKLSPFFIVLFTFCFTMTTEYVWELFEYGADRLIGSNMQRWQDGIVETLENGYVVSSIPFGSGLKDSMGDMGVNILGCLGVCIYALIGMKLKPDWFDGKLLLNTAQIDDYALELATKEFEELKTGEETQAEIAQAEAAATETDAETAGGEIPKNRYKCDDGNISDGKPDESVIESQENS